jgi:hypothetical protein
MAHQQILRAPLIGFLTILFVACATGTSSTSPSVATTHSPVVMVTAQPTATMLPSGTVLFQANWTHGLSSWQATARWKVVSGQLEANSSNSDSLTIPYKLTVSDYAIEVRFQIVGLLVKDGGYFTIVATKQPGKDGYQAGVSDLKGAGPFGSHPQAQVFIDPESDTTQGTGLPIDYEPGFGWHTFRIEVQGNEVRMLDGGTQIGRASSDRTDQLSNGPLGLAIAGIEVRVSSLRIVTL